MAAAEPLAAARHIPPTLVVLLAAALFINYVDRGSIATASPVLKDELKLSNEDYAFLASAFFWTYAPLQPVAGWLTLRVDVKWLMAGGLALWGVATAATGLAHSFSALLVFRVLLGIGESVAFPCVSQTLASRASPSERGRANAVMAIAQMAGPVVGAFFGGMILVAYSWRAIFLIFGLLSLLWLLPWAAYHGVARAIPLPAFRERLMAVAGPEGSTVAERAPPALRVILSQRRLWGTACSQLAHVYFQYFLQIWLPLFLVKARGFSLKAMAVISALFYLVGAVSAGLSGWATDRAVAAAPPSGSSQIRRRVVAGGLVGGGVCMVIMALVPDSMSLFPLFAGAVFFGVQIPALSAVTQTLAGSRAGGQWYGIQNMIGNVAGVVGPPVTGYVLDRTGSFEIPLLLCGACTFAGCYGFWVLIAVVEPVDWDLAEQLPVSGTPASDDERELGEVGGVSVSVSKPAAPLPVAVPVRRHVDGARLIADVLEPLTGAAGPFAAVDARTSPVVTGSSFDSVYVPPKLTV